ncbi:MAG: methyltransferase regulatory domain-containing protein [Opitutaceae bacterium]|nr:methyltransferase regulatory domain-containing protein [Opitutaceae bacterium]
MSLTSYDQIAYTSSSFPQSHPVKLATIARLFGLTPTNPARCNVLELGAADGANLIPLAQVYPESNFVGIDLSSRQVAEGRKLIDGAGLTNVTLEHRDIMEFDRKGMRFDYIIVHGVLSWVPPAVQERILSLCREALTPDGIAYISYNALPGWRLRGIMRDMMIYHANQFPDEATRASQARSLIKFLSDNVPTENNPYGDFLRSELAQMEQWTDSYILHEYLEETNSPFYFRDFHNLARRHQLQYLGEPELSSILPANFDQKTQETLHKISGDIIAMEQYMDFLRNRTFRMTLLVPRESVINRNINPILLREMWFGTRAQPVSEKVNLATGVTEHFKVGKATVNSDNTLVKATLVALHNAVPQYLHFNELLAALRNLLLGRSSGVMETAQAIQEHVILCDQLLILMSRGMVEGLAWPHVGIASTLPEKPRVTPLARYQALNYPRHVTNLRHQSIKFDAFARQAMSLMDGTRDRKEIIRGMAEKATQGAITVQNHGRTITDVDEIETLIAPRVTACIDQFPKLAMVLPE